MGWIQLTHISIGWNWQLEAWWCAESCRPNHIWLSQDQQIRFWGLKVCDNPVFTSRRARSRFPVLRFSELNRRKNKGCQVDLFLAWPSPPPFFFGPSLPRKTTSLGQAQILRINTHGRGFPSPTLVLRRRLPHHRRRSSVTDSRYFPSPTLALIRLIVGGWFFCRLVRGSIHGNGTSIRCRCSLADSDGEPGRSICL